MSCRPALLGAFLLGGCGVMGPRALPPSLASLRPDSIQVYSASSTLPQGGVEAYVAVAMEGNASLAAARATAVALSTRVVQERVLPEPTLKLAHFGEPIETRTGSQENRLGVSQRFPWPGKRDLRAAVASANAGAASAQADALAARIERDVRLAWHEYGYLAGALSAAREALELMQLLEPVAQARLRSGGPLGGLLQLQMEVGSLEVEVAGLEARRRPLGARLRSLLGLSPGDPPPWPIPGEELPVMPDEAESRAGVRRHAELAALAFLVEAGERQLDLAALESRPDVSVSLDWFQTDDAALAVAGSGKDPWSVGVAFPLPIRSRRYGAVQDEARAALLAARARWLDRRQGMESEREEAWWRLEDALRRTRLQGETLLPRARHALELADAAYRAGEATLDQVIQGQKDLLGFNTAVERARADSAQRHADLLYLTGGSNR